MTCGLRREIGFADPDAAYQSLVTLLTDLDEREARLALAELCLLLANHIGDDEILDEAVSAAKRAVEHHRGGAR